MNDEQDISQFELDQYCDDYDSWVDFELLTMEEIA